MKRLILLLIALPLWAVPPTVSSLSIDGLSHSVVRVHFNVSVPYLYVRFRYIRQADGICSGGSVALDHVQTITNDTPGSDPRGFFRQTDMTMVIGGLLGATPYNLCPEASTDNIAWSTGASIAFTTQALPAVHPALPIAPETFDPGPPDYGTGLTACPTLSSTRYCIQHTTCANLLTDWRAAANNQASFGTIVELDPGTTCTAITSVLSDQFAPDIIAFGANNINTGTGVITVPTLPAGFVSGTLVTFGTRGFLSNPSSTSCMSHDAFGGSFTYGVQYVATVLTSTTISLTCKDNGAPVVFGSAGTSPANFGFEFAPHYATTGNCPSAGGMTPCTYYKRSLFWKILRSAATDAELPPYPARITPAYCDTASKCVTLQDPVSNVNNGSSTHWFLNPNDADGNVATMDGNTRYGPGLKITCENDGSQRPYGVLFVTTGYASDIVFDRTYIPCGGGTPQRWSGPSLQGGQLDGMNVAFVGSWITNLTNWNTSSGIDSASILSAAVGPVVLYNNHIECAGICIHFDGGSNTAGNLLRGNYNVIRNEFTIPLKYMHGDPGNDGNWYGNRQPLECKNCWSILIEGNFFNKTFNDNTGASAFVALTSVVGFGDRDIDVRSNIFAHGPGIASSPTNVDGGAPITLPPIKYRFKNNLGIDIDGPVYWAGSGATAPTGRGWLFTGLQGTEDLTIEHNTIVGNVGAVASVFRFSDTNVEGVKVQNNFFTGFTSVDQGASQEGSVQTNDCINLLGEAQMNCKFTGTNPAVITRNVFMSTDGSSQATMNGWLPTLKNVNFIPATMSLATIPGWINYIAGTNATNGSYGLTPASTYRSGSASNGSDATDVGVDAVELGRATGHVIISGNPVTPVATTTAQINFVAPDNLSCPVDWSPAAFPATGVTPTRALDAGNTVGPRNVTLTGLPAATLIHFTVQCAVEQPSGTFTTRP